MMISYSRNRKVDSALIDELHTAALSIRHGQEYWEIALENDYAMLFAWDRDLLVGFADVDRRGSRCHLSALAVREGYRERGIGEHLLNNVVAQAQRDGCGRVYLYPLAHRDFYERHGFGPDPLKPGYLSLRLR